MPGKVIIEAAGLSDVGLKRSHNEDSFLVADLELGRAATGQVVTQLGRPSGALLIVADGMGGAAAGEVASRMAVEAMRDQLVTRLPQARRVPELAGHLQDSARHANTQIFNKSKGDKALRGMGTTLTATLCAGDLLFVSQVGDSRAYILRKGELTQITRDQSLVGQMIYEGKMSAEDARAKLPKNVILQAVGKKENLDPVLTVVELRADDRLVMCSDGLSNLVKDDEMRELLGTVPEPAKACQVLVDLARKRGGDDNITVVVGRITGDELRAAEDGMIPFYEDILARRGDEAIFQNPPPEEDLGDRTIVRTPATTAKLPPAPAPEAKPAARLDFDVDEVLGPSAKAAAEPAATVKVATQPPAPPPPVRPPPPPPPPPPPEPLSFDLDKASEDLTERLARALDAHDGAEAEAAPTVRISTAAARTIAKMPPPPPPAASERYPLSAPADRDKPPPPTPRPDLDATARQEGRFVHKPPDASALPEVPQVSAEAQTEALRRVQSSLDDSGLFKRDTGAHRKAAKSGGSGKMLIAAGAVGLAVAAAVFVMGRGKPTGTARSTAAPATRSAPPTDEPPAPPESPVATEPATPPAAPETPPPPPETPKHAATKVAPTPKETPTPAPTKIAEAPPGKGSGKKGKGTPEPKEPPLPKTGLLTIATTPPGAYVKINGELKGVTPKEIEIPVGEPLNLLIYKVGFQDHHEPAFTLTGKRQDVTLALKPR